MTMKIFASGSLSITGLQISAPITVLPTLWMRNLWSYGLTNKKPVIKWVGKNEAKQ